MRPTDDLEPTDDGELIDESAARDLARRLLGNTTETGDGVFLQGGGTDGRQ